MPRSEHFLFRSRPSPWPRTVVALHAGVTWIQSAEYAGREQCVLSRWYVAVAQKTQHGYSLSRSATGQSVSGFWDGMAECLNRAKGVYLICSCTRSAASALHLWEWLENGEIKVAGTDHRGAASIRRDVPALPGRGPDNGRRPALALAADAMPEVRGSVGKEKGNGRGNRGRGRKRNSGIMIVEDPPVVMELELAGATGKIVWVDVANYGLDSAALFGDDEHTAGKIATWFIGAADTVKSCGDAGWQNTAGSQAMHLFRSSYLETQILSHNQKQATSLESSALFGGRCECYRIGRVAGNCHLLDVRSMYPYICSVLPVPVRLCRILERPTVFALRDVSASCFCVADVDIETDSPDYPYRGDKSVCYPIGRFSATLCGHELDHALSVRAVRRVRRAATYETELAVARYAETLYALRCAYDRGGNVAQSAYVKRLMVSLVGKFAQRERSWDDMPGAESAYEWGEWYEKNGNGDCERWRSLAGHVQRERLGGFSHGAVPAIAAAITAAGRNRLARVIHAAGPGSVVYCDTDAVIVDDYGLESLSRSGWIKSGEWGFLQPVESADGCVIYGDKDYEIGGRIRAAGRVDGQSSTMAAGCDGGVQPWIGASMRNRERPADWRESHPYHRGEGRYDRPRGPGGVVRPVELWEW